MTGSPFDTIVAPITGPHPAPVAIVRLSGPESWSIASRIFDPWPDPVVPRFATYGRYPHGDDGLAVPFDDRSFTGEQSVELSLHGATISVRLLVEVCTRNGARMAEPGEFTLRAFLNGRIDLTQAEAVAETVAAASELQLCHANRIREGALNHPIVRIREAVLAAIAEIEAHVDFSEEIGDLDRTGVAGRLNALADELMAYIAGFGHGRMMREGIRVAIVGAPNAGKSSLLNSLLGSERAIVSPTPGTTRDYVEEAVEFGGWPVVFVDTAGIRHSADEIERIGVERSRRQAAIADIVLHVIDSTVGPSIDDVHIEGRRIMVANKCDLAPAPEGLLAISALTGQGLPQLRSAILDLAVSASPATLFVNRRQHDLLAEARLAIEEARSIISQSLPFDLAVVHLHASAEAIGKVTGETASEDMLQEIFSRFCIGK